MKKTKIILKDISSEYPQTSYQFTIIEIKWINTHQVRSVNIVLFNFLLKLLYQKKP